MDTKQEQYIIAAHGHTLTLSINAVAESRANKELLILLANKLLTFPEGHTAESHWQECFDTAFSTLTQQSQEKMLAAMQ